MYVCRWGPCGHEYTCLRRPEEGDGRFVGGQVTRGRELPEEGAGE